MLTSDQLGLEAPEHYVEVEEKHLASLRGRAAGEDAVDTGRDLFYLAWALEKQGRGHEALEKAQEARALFEEAQSWGLYAECSHSIGVWRFHNTVGELPVDDFAEAARVRSELGRPMNAAQSWHNLGFVQVVAGRAADAASSYRAALDLLETVRTGPDPEQAQSAFRQLGFVYSHQAYAAARFGDADEALEASVTYFRHVQKTGHHREPVYAYLAPGLALASDPGASRKAVVLEELVGVAPDAESWLSRAVSEASGALNGPASTGTGRRAYLGAHLLALGHRAQWCRSTGRAAEGAELLEHARTLARARGWAGEESRLGRFDGQD